MVATEAAFWLASRRDHQFLVSVKIRRALYSVPSDAKVDSDIFMSFYSARGRRFTGIGIHTQNPMNFGDEAIEELLKLALGDP